MLSPENVNQIAQAVVARLLRDDTFRGLSIQSNPNGNGKGKTLPPKISPEKRLLTVKEAAVFIGRSVSAVYHLVARREIAVVRHHRHLRFDVRELNRWIDGSKS